MTLGKNASGERMLPVMTPGRRRRRRRKEEGARARSCAARPTLRWTAMAAKKTFRLRKIFYSPEPAFDRRRSSSEEFKVKNGEGAGSEERGERARVTQGRVVSGCS